MVDSPAQGVAAAAEALRKARATTVGIAAKVAKDREDQRGSGDQGTAQAGGQS